MSNNADMKPTARTLCTLLNIKYDESNHNKGIYYFNYSGHDCQYNETTGKVTNSKNQEARAPYFIKNATKMDIDTIAEKILKIEGKRPHIEPDALDAEQLELENRPAENPEALPVIDSQNPNLMEVTRQAWEAIERRNQPRRLFLYGGHPSRLCINDGNPQVELLNKYMLQLEAANAAQWTKKHKNVDYPTRPPMAIVQSMLAAEKIPLPRLDRIVTAPVFSATGEIETEAGYHEKSRTYYFPGKLKVKPIPKKPSDGELKKAINVIKEPLQDFLFVSDADYSHAIGFMIVPFVRAMIPGAVPFGLGESDTPGTGKGLLTNVMLYPSTGGHHYTFSPSTNDEETRKRITAALSTAPPAIEIDNINDLSGPQFAALLTATTWTDRVLGKTETATFPVKSIILGTGNNVTLTTELARRVIRYRIESGTDKPWLRTGFKIKNLPEWTRNNRARMIEAILTVCQSWIAAGKPLPQVEPLGSFEDWTRVIGGILEHMGIKDFLGNILEVYEDSDLEGESWRTLISEWYNIHGTEPVTASTLFEIATDIDGLPIYGKNEQAQKKSFGKSLAKQRQRIFGVNNQNFQITKAGIYRRAITWQLRKPGEKPAGIIPGME